MNKVALFTDELLTCFAARLKQVLVDSAKTPLTIATIFFQAGMLAVVGFIEWEIIYRVFEFLSGEDEYWSPTVMGITAGVMVVGFHILGVTQPNNIAVRFVNRAVGILIPLYMVGVGLLIASILDVGSLIETDLPLALPGELPKPIEESWIEWFFSDVTTPLATLLFSLGLGGLAIVNIFVAHHLITRLIANVHEVNGRITTAKNAISDYRTIKRCQKEHAAQQQQLLELDNQSEAYICLTIVNQVLSLIDGALWSHKEYLSTHAVNGNAKFAPANTTNDKHIAKAVAQIEAISHADIMQHIQVPNPEKKK